MKDVMQIKRLVVTALWVLIVGFSARAIDPNLPAASILRTHFTTEEGLPAAVVDHIEQTPDGFLWIITNNQYLNRFDGKNFHYFDKPRIRRTALGPDGDLWAATPEGLARIPASKFNQFTTSGWSYYSPGPGKANTILSLRFSRSGVLWVGTADGLFRYERDQFVAVGPRVPTHRIEEAPDGNLLVNNDDGFMEFANSEVVPHPQLPAQLGVNNDEIFDVLKDRRGNTWYCTALGVARETNGKIEKLAPYARPGHRAFRAHEDPDGTIWIGREEGLFRATSDGGLELVADRMEVRSFFSDREGNLWIGTNGDGLYRFKDNAVRMFTINDGLPKNVIMSVIAHDGAVWTGANCGGVSRFDGTHFQTFKESEGLGNTCVWALAVDANGDLWAGTWGGGAYRYDNGKFTQYAKSQGMGDDIVTSIVGARDGAVWFATHSGVTRLKNGQLKTFAEAEGFVKSWSAGMFEDRDGVFWVGTQQGLYRFVNERFERHPAVPQILVSPLGADRHGGLFIALDVEPGPIAWRLDKDRIDIVKEVSAYDMVETEQGELWFGGNNISRILPGSFDHVRARDEPLDYEAFSPADGVSTAQTSGSDRSLALFDGKLWVATPQGLARFDLRRLAISNAKPTIYLTDLTIGRNTQRIAGDIVLPPGTNHVEIHFAAVEVSSPEKVRLQYRLDGVDSEWLDAPRNPVAIYSNIPVGTRTLRIRACNRNGVWDRQGMAFTITQQPYFYQTRWFMAAMLALGLLLIALGYRLRVAQISRQLSARFDERLAERTRVAREIHDTLLQTVQGSKMVADHALKNSADQDRMLRAMEQLSVWLGQATQEGRAALQSLRSSTTQKNDLAEAFRRAIDECGGGGSAEISFSVKGDSIELHPVVRDEIYRIGYEAIRNSCAHSGADRLEVTLEYGHDLTLRIIDNGVGIDSETVRQGKEGHFGLNGMRERAERIGSEFTLASSPDSGTAITLVVPGRVAFRATRRSWLDQLKSRIKF